MFCINMQTSLLEEVLIFVFKDATLLIMINKISLETLHGKIHILHILSMINFLIYM